MTERPNATTGPSPGTHEAFLAQKQFGSLDGIRALCILGVLWQHTAMRELAAGETPWLPMSQVGYLGVDMFFVLSGFLISTLLQRERAKHGGISLKDFYARRTLRIFPIYYIVLIGVAALYLVKEHVLHKDPASGEVFFRALPWYATYTSNFLHPDLQANSLGITWSLATEEQFYILWSLAEFGLGRRWRLGLVALLIGVSQAINFRVPGVGDVMEQAIGARWAELPIMQATFTPILLGVLLAHLMDHKAWFDRITAVLSPAMSPVGCLVLLLGLCNIGGDIQGWPRLLIQVAMMVFVASCVVREDHALRRPLSWRPIVWVGRISYGMYLYHIFLVWPIRSRLVPHGWDQSPVEFGVVLAATILIASISFVVIERPILGLKKRFTRVEAGR